MKENTLIQQVDQNELRVMQFCVMLMLLTGFILNQWEVIAAQVVIFLLTVISTSLNPFILLYRFILRPLNIINSDYREDHLQPHRFASSIGFFVSSCSVYFLITGNDVIGWGLSVLIVILGVFALSGWCAGCFSYYMINRIGLKGFFKYSPVNDSFPGARPPKNK
ncbi:MAG: hypothetical protein DIZ80_08230 [endosymbiont of Galathealinum brachiosum]|uniref:DUF4395 domain-containing protein n=1 Tax=endosymbiont of Galathealinum brachiosum TaxID=2200906 RepID=A0A370DGR8_9GAMM|nr:MAG: hypothetical protein DIZ80_08230 [endosymbiont of Galathealinum brachiosum]